MDDWLFIGCVDDLYQYASCYWADSLETRLELLVAHTVDHTNQKISITNYVPHPNNGRDNIFKAIHAWRKGDIASITAFYAYSL